MLNAVFFAVVAGVGLALFQQIIPRPGLASGLYTNTRRIGAIVSGPLIALGSLAVGYRAVFVACAALTGLALLVVTVLIVTTRRGQDARGADELDQGVPSATRRLVDVIAAPRGERPCQTQEASTASHLLVAPLDSPRFRPTATTAGPAGR